MKIMRVIPTIQNNRTQNQTAFGAVFTEASNPIVKDVLQLPLQELKIIKNIVSKQGKHPIIHLSESPTRIHWSVNVFYPKTGNGLGRSVHIDKADLTVSVSNLLLNIKNLAHQLVDQLNKRESGNKVRQSQKTYHTRPNRKIIKMKGRKNNANYANYIDE